MCNNNLPLVVDIKRDSLEDGPGIRSVVFFKGCPLRCTFCHSPETQDPRTEISFSERKCLRCGRCADCCPQGAIDLSIPQRIDRTGCTRCGQCAAICPEKALRKIGQYYPVDCLVEILLRDLSFYRHSDGGVTFSGGECTLYPKYIESLLEKRTVVHPRVPLIPGITATSENLSAIVDLLVEAGAEDVSLLPYNPMGIEMAANLGRPRPNLPESFMSPEEEKEVCDTFRTALMVNTPR